MKKKKSFIALALVVAVLVIVYSATTFSPTVFNDLTDSVAVFPSPLVAVSVWPAKVPVVVMLALVKLTSKLLSSGLTVISPFTFKSITVRAYPTATQTNDAAKEYYTVTAVLADNNPIAPNGTKKLTVTVELVKAPLEEVTGAFEVAFNATATK